MQTAAAIILDEEAERYVALLQGLRAEGVALSPACTAEEALAAYADQSILLGDPNLVAKVLPRMPTIRWVQSTWAGVTPLLEIDQRGYVLTGVKEVFGQPMTEYVLGYLLAHELKIPQRAEYQRRRSWFDACSGTLRDKLLGIMGTGSIGRHIARVSQAFGMRVRGYSRSGSPAQGFEQVFAADRLPAFLRDLDYLVSVLPDTRETDRLLDAATLGHLPKRCYYVNVGRGNVVDEAALVSALRAGELAGATLDVFDREPLPEHSPLWTTPNLVVTAHVAAPSDAEQIAPIFAENLRRFVRGDALDYVIDFERGY